MSEVKKFNAKVKDKLGWSYDEAFVAIYLVDEYSSTSLIADEDLNHYAEEFRPGKIVYSGNFWGNEEGQQAGLESRPLLAKKTFPAITDDNGIEITPEHIEWDTVLEVDLLHPQSLAVMSGGGTERDKKLRMIELDVVRRGQ